MAVLRLVPASGSPIEITGDQGVVGRESSCDVVVSDGSVSRKHARLERHGSTWMVIDQGSANGTFLDTQKIAESALKNGQELRFGAVSFRVEISGEEDMGATVANIPVLEDEDAATMMHKTPPKVPARAPAPPPLPRAAAPPPPPAPRAASVPPPPPSAAAARERFRPPAPAGASPVAQMPSSSAAPPKKGRGPFFWIVTGCCGCLLLVGLLAAVVIGAAFLMSKGAVDAVHLTLQQVKQGEIDKAYEGLAPTYKNEMSLQDFERIVSRHPGLKDNTDSTFYSRNVSNDTATISGVLTSSSGPPEPVTFKLVREGGVWRISEISFEVGKLGRAGPEERAGPFRVRRTLLLT
jgi:pSer/pThr/pTyr-binding forkhead associated (FHA) protein